MAAILESEARGLVRQAAVASSSELIVRALGEADCEWRPEPDAAAGEEARI
jgi:hypothetical protein